MKVRKQGEVYILAFDLGDDLIPKLIEFADEKKVRSAYFHGIGAIRDFELGYYILNRKTYKRKKFSEIAELLSCDGNLAVREGKTFAHVHVSLGRKNFTVMGGHLFSAVVAVTAEIIFHPLATKLNRAYDDTTGLYLLDLASRKTF